MAQAPFPFRGGEGCRGEAILLLESNRNTRMTTLAQCNGMSPELQQIITLVSTTGDLAGLQPDQDIYDAGFSSIHALQLLVELEDSFGVTLGDDDFIAARTPQDLFNLVTGARKD
jgi:acyl carrier protein